MYEKWFFVCLILALLLLAGITIDLLYLRRKKAKEEVKSRSDSRKLQEINEALRPFGFCYDVKKDIFYSLRDAWQRSVGYGKIYDEMAPAMNMVIDCEPIYFEYDGRRWMVELWKGQYGITSGAEVGIYVESGKNREEAAEDVFYQAVSEDEEVRMSMALYKDGKMLFQREERHWWLTGFRLGEFSKPGELMLRASILFPNQEMMHAFLDGCRRAGYRLGDIYVRYNGVAINFARPKTAQPTFFGKCHCRFIQWQNRCNCKLYLYLTRPFDRTLDRLDYLMMEYPLIFHMVTGLGRIGRMQEKMGRKGRRYARLKNAAGRKGRSTERAGDEWNAAGRGGRRR